MSQTRSKRQRARTNPQHIEPTSSQSCLPDHVPVSRRDWGASTADAEVRRAALEAREERG